MKTLRMATLKAEYAIRTFLVSCENPGEASCKKKKTKKLVLVSHRMNLPSLRSIFECMAITAATIGCASKACQLFSVPGKHRAEVIAAEVRAISEWARRYVATSGVGIGL